MKLTKSNDLGLTASGGFSTNGLSSNLTGLLDSYDPKLTATHQFYDLNAESYFTSTINIALDGLWSRFEKELYDNSTILDLGSGSGRDTKHFSKLGHNVIGIDHSYPLLTLAKYHSGLSFVNGDFVSLPFRNNSFDAIWAAACLLHLPDRFLQGSLKELHRVLKRGGTLFTSIKKGNGEATDSQGRYNLFYQTNEWVSELLSHKFHNVKVIGQDAENRSFSSETQESCYWIACIAHAE